MTTNPAGYGVINVPQANIVFAPIPINVDDISITARIQPTANATGFIDPLSGRVDLSMPIRLKAEGAALGQNLGDNCYIGSAGNPINIATTTSTGTFPTTNPTPTQTTYVADFISDGSGYDGGWLAAEPYSDEAGVWPIGAKVTPGFPVGGTKPTRPDPERPADRLQVTRCRFVAWRERDSGRPGRNQLRYRHPPGHDHRPGQ